MIKKAVFLDRDGVINKSYVIDGKPFPPYKLEEVVIIDGVAEAIQNLRDLKFEIIVVTNQPDIARKKTTLKFINSIHKIIEEKIGRIHFYICPHDDFDNCSCRKPKPGLLRTAALELNIDLNTSYLVGDRWRDIQAGQAAGCECFYIDYKYEDVQPKSPFIQVASLLEASNLISERNRQNGHQ